MIVDDHPIVRDGLKNMLQAFDDLELVGEAGDGDEALICCRQSQPDVILMDVMMPKMDGIATLRAILEMEPKLKVIMLTSFVEGQQVQAALECGAAGYLIKNVAIATLADAIRAVYAGQTSLASESTTALLHARKDTPRLGHNLTRRELEVLQLVAEGLSNDEIATRLVISTPTARHHVGACLQKLGVNNRAQAAVLAIGGVMVCRDRLSAQPAADRY